MLFFLLFALSIRSFAQSVIITPQKKIYARKGKDVPKERKTFVVVYPVINSANPALKTKIENKLNYWKVFDSSLKNNLNDDFWLTNLYYKVNYNKNFLLDILLTQEGIVAYPDAQTVNFVSNLKTGEQVKAQEVFVESKLLELAAKIKKLQHVEVKTAIQNAKKKGDEYDIESNFAETDFTIEDLDNFSISDKGVTFLYDYSFPHVILALQPEGKYFFSWVRLKPFVKRDGVFAKFIR